MSKLEIGKVPVDILNRIVLDPINNNINKRKYLDLREYMKQVIKSYK